MLQLPETNYLPLTLAFMNLLSDLQLSSTGRVELLRALNSEKVTKSLYSKWGEKGLLTKTSPSQVFLPEFCL